MQKERGPAFPASKSSLEAAPAPATQHYIHAGEPKQDEQNCPTEPNLQTELRKLLQQILRWATEFGGGRCTWIDHRNSHLGGDTIDSTWVRDLNAKLETNKLLEEHMGKSFYHLCMGKISLRLKMQMQ